MTSDGCSYTNIQVQNGLGSRHLTHARMVQLHGSYSNVQVDNAFHIFKQVYGRAQLKGATKIKCRHDLIMFSTRIRHVQAEACAQLI